MSLKTDYKDDILATGNLRKYQMINNSDGTVSFQDVTVYEQTGDIFGAGDINKTNQAVNEKFDSDDVVDPMETTEHGFAADALAVKNQFNEQNKNFAEKIQWWIDHHYLPDPSNARLYLYSYGNTYNDITNGYVEKDWESGGTLTFKSESMSLVTNSSTSNYVGAMTNYSIDISAYKKLKAKVDYTKNSGSIFIYVTQNTSTNPTNLGANQYTRYDASVDGEIEVDVTQFSGEYYIGVAVRGYSKSDSALVYEIWLE